MSFLVWQLIDSGFPAGGFAHSGGLEASAQQGLTSDAGGVLSFARQALGQVGRSALPLMTAAYKDPSSLKALDRLSDIFLTNPIANRSSRAQGRAFLTSVARSFPRAELSPLEATIAADGLCSHYAPVFGAVLEALDVDLGEAQRAFLFVGVRNVVTAGVRLGLIGAYEAQEAQSLLASEIERTIRRCGGLGAADIAQTAPLIDLCQSTHDRLYSRLFQS